MLKILLVDDEVAICSGMKKLILKSDAESFIVAEAYDGVEALDMLEAFNPDVLLTDMRMPRMDGLQLLREAKARKPDLLTAVISAYSDYGYIREAMLLHASDYLLKPATAKDLQELLLKLKVKHKQLLMVKEQEALGRLLQGLVPDNYAPSLVYAHYALLLVCAGPYINGVIDVCPGDVLWQSPLFTESLAQLKELGIREWIFNGERTNEKFILLAANGEAAAATISLAMDKFLQSLLGQPVPVTLVVDSDLPLNQLSATSKQLRRELLHSLVFAKSQILDLKDSSVGALDVKPAFTAETAKVMEAATQKQYKRFTLELNDLISSWERGDATQRIIQQTLFRVLAVLGEQGFERHNHFEMIVSPSLSYTDLRNNISVFFQHLFATPSTAAKPANVDTYVGQVVLFLKKNFRESITLQSLSQEFGLVPNYLSVLFKREIGITPVEYLMEYRINEAKRIMDEQPHMLLKQVASDVGYTDQLYFSRVFKKLTGQSPREYIQSREQR
jgi:two-component system response regulator YesN